MDIELKQELQRKAGIPHLPTDLTYELRLAVSGNGPRAFEWSDKPHRLLFDACRAIEAYEDRLAQALMAEREACAIICDVEADEFGGDEYMWSDACQHCADFIRARGGE
jgi:hypothetical protein